MRRARTKAAVSRDHTVLVDKMHVLDTKVDEIASKLEKISSLIGDLVPRTLEPPSTCSLGNLEHNMEILAHKVDLATYTAC